MQDTRSPLKDKPLRNPGQSVREERMDIVFDKLLPSLMACTLLGTMAMLEWLRYFYPAKLQPWVATTIAVSALGYTLWQVRKYWPKIMALKLAEDGEKAVGQFLEGLRESGCQVFHDVVGVGFNVDHVVIGPYGIFTIETKTWKKPRRGSPQITFDGERLMVGGLAPERDPVIQAKAQAGWLRQLLLESTGKPFTVRPVILFPGWFINATPESRRNVWVLEPKAFRAFLEQEKTQIAPEDVKLAAFHLSRFIRHHERAAEAAK